MDCEDYFDDLEFLRQTYAKVKCDEGRLKIYGEAEVPHLFDESLFSARQHLAVHYVDSVLAPTYGQTMRTHQKAKKEDNILCPKKDLAGLCSPSSRRTPASFFSIPLRLPTAEQCQ